MRQLALIVLAVVVLALGLLELPEDRVVFLDVGQGDSMLLQNGSAQVLIDGGEGMQVLERLAEEMPFFDRSIELVIETHPERDHMEGLIHVLDRYSVNMMIFPRIPKGSQLQEEWLLRLASKEIPYRFAFRGQTVRLRDIKVSILAPFDEPIARKVALANSNNGSVTTRVEFHGMSFLGTGDAERQVEYWLTRAGDTDFLDVDVLKAGHHGSKTSTTQALINVASPSAAVISVGLDNRFGHPHASVTERLQNIPTYRTDKHGSVRFEDVGERWRILCGNLYAQPCPL